MVENTANITYTGGGPLYSNTVQTTVIAPDPLDHFEIAQLSSPQVKGEPFPITVYAKDSSGQTVESFEGTISAGYYHSLALRSDGSLAAWGVNNQGQLNIPSGDNYVAISAGAYHCLALREDGSIAGWGYNDHGQATPPAGNDYVAISAGNYHSLALRADGSLVAWGNNAYGQTAAPSGNDFVAISAGDHHCLALREDGSVAAWGYNGSGQTNTPQGRFVAGVFSGLVSIGMAHAQNTITVEYDGKTGTSGTFEVVMLAPDLSTSGKEVDLEEIIPQSVLNYMINCRNTGAGEATQTVVFDYLDANLEDVANITGGGTYNAIEHKITWDLGILESQQAIQLGFSARVKASATPGTVISNQAQVDCAELDPFTTNTVQSMVITGSVDHFSVIAPASAYVGQPFEINLTALDAFGNTVAGYQGTALLTTSGTGTLDPAQATFSAGEATL
ncbi:MAG: hypothetical protein PHS26_06850, partial [Actinomycetota bacterium]|nr:hypothetical protein [Actinomycetota bacterium]